MQAVVLRIQDFFEFFLGAIMVLSGFGLHIPEFVSPIITFAVIGFFFVKSKQELERDAEKAKRPGDGKPLG